MYFHRRFGLGVVFIKCEAWVAVLVERKAHILHLFVQAYGGPLLWICALAGAVCVGGRLVALLICSGVQCICGVISAAGVHCHADAVGGQHTMIGQGEGQPQLAGVIAPGGRAALPP